MIYNLSHNDEYVINKTHVQNISKMGRDAFNNAWKELVEFGYIHQDRHLSSWNYTINEIPKPEEWLDVMAWMIDNGLLVHSLPYEKSVSREFLP